MPFVYTTRLCVLIGRSAWESHYPDHATPAGLTHDRFGLFRFRSPLLTESRLFSLPVGTEMFHFPTFPLPALYIQAGVSRSYRYADRGFPIRRPSDRSSLISSPRIIADCYVLLRLQLPRHPPFALRNLTTYMSMNRAHHRHLSAPITDMTNG